MAGVAGLVGAAAGATPWGAIASSVASIGSTIYGAVQEGKERKRMAKERQAWNSDNEAMFNKDYYSDYMQRADTQNLVKNMSDEIKGQNKVDQNMSVVTGATPEAANAAKEGRNRAMTSVFSNIAAQGAQFKDRTKDQYLSRKTALQGMEYDNMEQNAASSNNLLYNGIKGMGNTDWASIVSGGKTTGTGSAGKGKIIGFDNTPAPKTGLELNIG